MRTPALLLAFGLVALQARAQTQGVLIKGKNTGGGQTTVVEIRLGKTHLRTDMTAADGEPASAIFDATKQTFVQFAPSRKAYTEMSKTEMDRILTETIRRAMPNPTPEQQARVDEMLRARTASTTAPLPVREFFPFSKDKVGAWPCTNYAPPGGSIICTADPSLFGLTPEDFAVLRLLEQFELSLVGGLEPAGASPRGIGSMSPAGQVFVEGISEGKPFAGVVLKITRGSTPQYSSFFEVTEIRRVELPPNLFEIPAGLTKEIMPVPQVPVRTPVVR